MKRITIFLLLITFHFSLQAQGILDIVKNKVTNTATKKARVISDVHDKYEKQVKFTSKPVTFAEMKETDFISSYDMTGPLFMYVFLHKPLTKQVLAFPAACTYVLNFYLDGELAHTIKLPSEIWNDEQKKNMMEWGLELKNPSSKIISIPARAWGEFIVKSEKKMTQGKHILKLEAIATGIRVIPGAALDSKKMSGSGELTLNIKSKLIDKNDLATCLYTAGLKNKTLEAHLTKVAKAYSKENIKPLKTIITSYGWTTRKNEYGRILNRIIVAAVGYELEGRCQTAFMSFAQDYIGGSSYSTNTYVDFVDTVF
ncbi:MAG: hypothetical protein IPJ81_19405 [Chitinophagaceae bacterium]|nr:hypothetical protein [Chitinophagaceae bacterium]